MRGFSNTAQKTRASLVRDVLQGRASLQVSGKLELMRPQSGRTKAYCESHAYLLFFKGSWPDHRTIVAWLNHENLVNLGAGIESAGFGGDMVR